MNWGHKITAVIAIFIIAMMSMVYLAFQQTNDMVDTNYYDKELKYQLKIDAAQNLNSATSEVLVTQFEKKCEGHITQKFNSEFCEWQIRIFEKR